MTRSAGGPDRWPIVLGLFGLSNLLNGLWMLASPASWYTNLPADVPGSGPLNEHFVRDIGCVFTLLGIALLWSIPRRSLRVPAMVAAAAFSSAHALVHVYDQLRGLFAPEHLGFDIGPVYVSTLILVLITWKLAREEGSAA